ncbi:MAG: 4-hydroxy-3-methylbut-2-enyl diphosphate reductase [Treponemataceae bacterium]|nr:4-hydroxy-3-methylbut-2-enyl diphosphate reductase [Treponemataceae bacterium]
MEVQNVQVVKARVLGYCMGVRRAVEIAEQALAQKSDESVYSLGPLIHNNSALETLSEKGLELLEEDRISELKDKKSVVIIRAHGVSPQIRAKLLENNCRIIDATCPRVLANQKLAEKCAQENRTLFLAGDKNHGEVAAVAGCAPKNCIVIENPEQAEQLDVKNIENATILCQTTFSQTQYEKISSILSAKIPNLKIMNTICPATKERQEALRDLCSQVEGVIVIGGKNSANTKRLFNTANTNAPKACLIESEKEIPADFFGLSKIGLTAGASTPDFVISAVESRLFNRL